MVKDNFKGASANACFAIFDGHGGQKAADFCKNKLSGMLESQPTLETNVMRIVKSGKRKFPNFLSILVSISLPGLIIRCFRPNFAYF